jgi:hypothetical protein
MPYVMAEVATGANARPLARRRRRLSGTRGFAVFRKNMKDDAPIAEGRMSAVRHKVALRETKAVNAHSIYRQNGPIPLEAMVTQDHIRCWATPPNLCHRPEPSGYSGLGLSLIVENDLCHRHDDVRNRVGT